MEARQAGSVDHGNGASAPAPVRGEGFDPAASPPPAKTTSEFAVWNLRGLIAAHKTASLVIAALAAVTVAAFVLTALGGQAGAVTDRTTCQGWSSANVNQQNAYARLYVSEHGPVNPKWGPVPVGVINAINAGCDEAFGEDVSDTATVIQAINRTF